MTILIHFHQSHYRTFKAYYTEHVQVYLTSEFPHLVSDTRFVALIPSMLVPLLASLQSRYGACTGISFIIASLLPMPSGGSRQWAGSLASSSIWRSTIKASCSRAALTPGNVDDRAPVPQMVQHLRGKLIGDRGYISAPLTALLFKQGLQLMTRLRKNMKNHPMHLSDKLLVRKRAIIESIIDQLKNISQIEHSRHRSPTNFVVHLIAGHLASSHQAKKPGLHLDQRLLLAL
jgi:hypothetical protein